MSSCSINKEYENLQEYVDSKSSKFSSVIACAASSKSVDSLFLHVFFYPRENSTHFQLFETKSALVDPTDLTQYEKVEASVLDVFGGKLQKYEVNKTVDNFMIVTFEENDSIHVSDPIRTRLVEKTTKWNNEVVLNHDIPLRPRFSWDDISDAVIYFQVVSSIDNNFLSGTYTLDTNFTYQDKTNVVLDINTEEAVDLIPEAIYNFTLMAVSEDNWVITVAEKTFIAE